MKLLIKAAIAAAFIGGKAAFAAPTQSCLPDDVLYVSLNFPTGVPDSACCSGKSAGSYCVSLDTFSGPAIKLVKPRAFVILQQPIPTPEKESTPTPSSTPPPPAPVPSTSATCGETCQTPLPVPLLSPPDSAHPLNLLPEPTSPGPVYTTTLAGKGAEALDPTTHVPIPVKESSVVSITTHVPIPVQDSSASQITTRVPVPVEESPVVSIKTHVPIPVQESSTFHLTTRIPIPVKESWTGPVWRSLSPWPTPSPRVPIPVSVTQNSSSAHHFGPGWSHTIPHQSLTTPSKLPSITAPITLSGDHTLSSDDGSNHTRHIHLEHSRHTPHFGPGWSHTLAHQPLTTPTPTTLATKVVKARHKSSSYKFPTPRVPIPISALPGHHHIGPGWSHSLAHQPLTTPVPTTWIDSEVINSQVDTSTFAFLTPRIPIPVSEGDDFTLHGGPSHIPTNAVEARDETSTFTFPTPRIPIPVAEGRPFTLHGGPSVRSTKAMEARDETSTYTFPTPRVPIPVAEGRPFTLHGGPSVRSTQTVEARDEEPTSAYTFPTPRVPIPVSERSHIGPGWSHTLHGGPADFPTTTSTSTTTSSEPHHFGPGWSHTLHGGPTDLPTTTSAAPTTASTMTTSSEPHHFGPGWSHSLSVEPLPTSLEA